MGVNADLETLKKRLASWQESEGHGPPWLRDIAPTIIAGLKAEIAKRKAA